MTIKKSQLKKGDKVFVLQRNRKLGETIEAVSATITNIKKDKKLMGATYQYHLNNEVWVDDFRVYTDYPEEKITLHNNLVLAQCQYDCEQLDNLKKQIEFHTAFMAENNLEEILDKICLSLCDNKIEIHNKVYDYKTICIQGSLALFVPSMADDILYNNRSYLAKMEETNTNIIDKIDKEMNRLNAIIDNIEQQTQLKM